MENNTPKTDTNSGISYNNLVDKITVYIDNENLTGRAIMLDGPWGVGKSYFIRYELKKELEKLRCKIAQWILNLPDVPVLNIIKSFIYPKCIIVSLYGIKDIKTLNTAVYTQFRWSNYLHKLPKFLSSFAFFTSTGGMFALYREFKWSFGWILVIWLVIEIGLSWCHFKSIEFENTIHIGDIKKLGKKLTRTLIVLEDVERTELNIKELLGWVNALCDYYKNNKNLGAKILLVAHEKKLIENFVMKQRAIYQRTDFYYEFYEKYSQEYQEDSDMAFKDRKICKDRGMDESWYDDEMKRINEQTSELTNKYSDKHKEDKFFVERIEQIYKEEKEKAISETLDYLTFIGDKNYICDSLISLIQKHYAKSDGVKKDLDLFKVNESKKEINESENSNQKNKESTDNKPRRYSDYKNTFFGYINGISRYLKGERKKPAWTEEFKWKEEFNCRTFIFALQKICDILEVIQKEKIKVNATFKRCIFLSIMERYYSIIKIPPSKYQTRLEDYKKWHTSCCYDFGYMFCESSSYDFRDLCETSRILLPYVGFAFCLNEDHLPTATEITNTWKAYKKYLKKQRAVFRYYEIIGYTGYDDDTKNVEVWHPKYPKLYELCKVRNNKKFAEFKTRFCGIWEFKYEKKRVRFRDNNAENEEVVENIYNELISNKKIKCFPEDDDYYYVIFYIFYLKAGNIHTEKIDVLSEKILQKIKKRIAKNLSKQKSGSFVTSIHSRPYTDNYFYTNPGGREEYFEYLNSISQYLATNKQDVKKLTEDDIIRIAIKGTSYGDDFGPPNPSTLANYLQYGNWELVTTKVIRAIINKEQVEKAVRRSKYDQEQYLEILNSLCKVKRNHDDGRFILSNDNYKRVIEVMEQCVTSLKEIVTYYSNDTSISNRGQIINFCNSAISLLENAINGV